MAKNVDLSSKEWCDIVFEGKNKDFGAYVMRKNSPHRHTRAVVIVLIALAILLGLLILSVSGVFSKAEEEGPDASIDQEMLALAQEEAIEEEQIEEQPIIEQPEEEIIQPEEVANEQRVTDILVVEDENFEADKQVKTQEEATQNEAQIGAIDVTEGTNDLDKQSIREQVVQEAPVVEEEKVYTMAMVEQKPSFPGGDAAMYKWLGEHINYPAQASEEGVQGRVVVMFDVDKTGQIVNVKIARGRHPALDKEAMRLVKSMPKWQPGRNNGQPVKVTYTLPVTFKLQQ